MLNYTGLALMTGVRAPDIETQIVEALSAFTIQIIDKQSIDIRDRYFLAIYFKLDPAHQKAITKDLEMVTERLKLDLAIDYQSES